MDRIAVLSSGGDAPGMNAAIRAVVRKGIYHGLKVFGIEHGFSGMVRGCYRLLNQGSVGDILHRGGTILKTARCPDFFESRVQDEAASFLLNRLGVNGLVVIGGDGSFRGGACLQERGINVIGVPATIDNDIPFCEMTIGYDTAVNTVIDSINRLRDTATSHERIYVVEVMGKNTGSIALAAGLAGGAESILVPEVRFNVEDICSRLQKGIDRGKSHSIIVAAEGAAGAIEIGRQIETKMGLEVRVTILGHLQRGGNPSAYDRILASCMAAKSVDALLEGRGGGAVCLQGRAITLVSFAKIFESKSAFREDLYELAGILSV